MKMKKDMLMTTLPRFKLLEMESLGCSSMMEKGLWKDFRSSQHHFLLQVCQARVQVSAVVEEINEIFLTHLP